MKERINEIMDNLTDEMNVQPIVYNLFEKANPEEVKKTIESLQRALEIKNDEVKKSLSANHEHLFSCTDMVEQLKDYSKLSEKHINLLRNVDHTDVEVSLPARRESDGYEVNEFVYYRELSQKLSSLASRHWMESFVGLLNFKELAISKRQHVRELQCCWIGQIDKLVHLFKSSITHGRELTQEFIDVFYSIMLLAFEPNSVFSPMQAIHALCKRLGLSKFEFDPTDKLPFDAVLSSILECFYEFISNSNEKIDLIEIIKLHIFLDSRRVIRLSEAGKSSQGYKFICDMLFNDSLYSYERSDDHQQMNQKLQAALKKLAQAEEIQSRDSKGKFIDIYQRNISKLLSHFTLLAGSEVFRYDTVKRFFQEKRKIEQWEEYCKLNEDSRIMKAINSSWSSYCKQVVEKLNKNLDFLRISQNAPSSFKGSEGEDYLSKLEKDVQEALSSVMNLKRSSMLELTDVSMDSFHSNAEERLRELLMNKIEEMLRFVSSHPNDALLMQHLFILTLVLHDHNIISSISSSEAHRDTITTYRQQLDAALKLSIEQNDINKLFSIINHLFKRFNISASPSSHALHFMLVLLHLLSVAHPDSSDLFLQLKNLLQHPASKDHSAVATNPTYATFRINYPLLFPFLLAPPSRRDAQAPPQQDQIVLTQYEFEGFTHEELLSQYRAN